MTDDVMKAVNERLSEWFDYLTRRGYGKPEATRTAAQYACMNRQERRKFLGERGKKRDLPRYMTTVKTRKP